MLLHIFVPLHMPFPLSNMPSPSPVPTLLTRKALIYIFLYIEDWLGHNLSWSLLLTSSAWHHLPTSTSVPLHMVLLQPLLHCIEMQLFTCLFSLLFLGSSKAGPNNILLQISRTCLAHSRFLYLLNWPDKGIFTNMSTICYDIELCIRVQMNTKFYSGKQNQTFKVAQ